VAVGDDEEGGCVIDRLAGVLIRLQDVAIRAGAEVGALGVGTLLGAQARGIAFVRVHAGVAILADFRPGWTDAQRSVGGLLAEAGALTRLMLALGQVAALALVGAIGTVGGVVAHGRDVHTPLGDPGTLPLAVGTLEGRRDTGVLGSLVRVVPTIVLAIANVGLEHTVRVVALEEVLGTGDLAAVLLIRVIRAVVGAIAVPSDWDAEPGGLAAEVLLQIALIGSHWGAAHLVGAIIAVRYAIAFV